MVSRYSVVSLVAVYQFEDGVDDGTDAFEREPFCIRVRPVGGEYIFYKICASKKTMTSLENKCP